MRATEYVDDTMFYREAPPPDLPRDARRSPSAASVVDPLTLADELQRRGELEARGGKDYIGFLVDAVPTSANVEYHAKIVREKALLRRLIEVSTEIVAEAFEAGDARRAARPRGAEDLPGQRSSAAARASRASRSSSGRRWSASRRCSAAAKPITGVASGFTDLDELTSGFQPSDLIIVAARPSMGKTAFMLNIAQHAAIEHERAGRRSSRSK